MTDDVPNYKGKSLLVVEDDEISAILIEEYLARTQIEIHFANDGLKAVQYIKDNPSTNVILMDIQLPNMDGMSAFKKIRQINSDIIIIAQTAFYSSDLRKQCLSMGFNDFLNKPIIYTELLQKLAFLL